MDECGGVGGKCESVCGTKGYCCNPSNGFGDCVEMIHYGMMIQKDYTDEFQCVQYNANYSYTCDHPDYTLVELKSGILCLRAFEQLVTFNEATNICHFDARSRMVGPGDEEDAKLMTSMINHQPLWLPPRNIDGQWRDYQTQYQVRYSPECNMNFKKSLFQSTFLNFAPREPDGGDHDHLQLNAFGRVQDEPGTTEAFFICGRDPYFTYSPRADYDYNNASDYVATDGFVSGRIR